MGIGEDRAVTGFGSHNAEQTANPTRFAVTHILGRIIRDRFDHTTAFAVRYGNNIRSAHEAANAERRNIRLFRNTIGHNTNIGSAVFEGGLVGNTRKSTDCRSLDIITVYAFTAFKIRVADPQVLDGGAVCISKKSYGIVAVAIQTADGVSVSV